MILHALGAGQHHVVVGHDHGTTTVFREQVTVNLTQTSDHAIARGVLNQVFNGAAPALPGDHHRAVLDKRSLVTQMRDVLTRRSPACFITLGNRLRAIFVESRAFTVDHLLQIRTDIVEV